MKRLSCLSLATVLAVVCIAFGATPARAATIQVELAFPGGFNLSLNGGAAALSGPLTFTGLIDNTTPDLNPAAGRGDFTMLSLALTAASYGFVNEPVVAPNPLLLRWFSGGFAIVDVSDVLDIGWNGGPVPPGDRDDLTTLAIPTFSAMTSTFFLSTITLQSGDTLFGNIGGGGATGTFSATSAVPEPATLLLLGAGLCAVVTRRRLTKHV